MTGPAWVGWVPSWLWSACCSGLTNHRHYAKLLPLPLLLLPHAPDSHQWCRQKDGTMLLQPGGLSLLQRRSHFPMPRNAGCMGCVLGLQVAMISRLLPWMGAGGCPTTLKPHDCWAKSAVMTAEQAAVSLSGASKQKRAAAAAAHCRPTYQAVSRSVGRRSEEINTPANTHTHATQAYARGAELSIKRGHVAAACAALLGALSKDFHPATWPGQKHGQHSTAQAMPQGSAGDSSLAPINTLPQTHTQTRHMSSNLSKATLTASATHRAHTPSSCGRATQVLKAPPLLPDKAKGNRLCACWQLLWMLAQA